MDVKLKKCPFCGGEAFLQIRDSEGNLHDEDYEKDPWSGLAYTIGHWHEGNELCPIATYFSDDGHLGVYLYDSTERAIEAWNRRADDDPS